MRGLLALAAVIWVGHWVGQTAGQGLLPMQSSTVGATSTLQQLQQQYSSSRAWRNTYKQRPAAACNNARGASLCAAAASDSINAYAQLMLATSPQVYSSTDNSKVRLVSPAQDQGPCQSCAAFAVAAAAETAIASALQVDVQQCSISVHALYFCPPDRPSRSCSAGWNLLGALEQLQQQVQNIPTAACLKYQPDYRQELTRSQLCSGTCQDTSPHIATGQLSSRQITSMWEAQLHIRRHGAVVSRFDVYSDFRSFFSDKRNAKAVYRPSPNATFQFAHAVTLVGYDNQKQYWLVKNSWGRSWGDDGFFRVAYGTCSVLTPESGEAHGVEWTPFSIPDALQLKLTAGPPGRPGCYNYKAQIGDYPSRVAWLAGIQLEQFMLDNTANIKDLDAPLQGVLLLCNPKPGSRYDAASLTPQLEALLRFKAAVDQSGSMHWWNRAAGANGGYCNWNGVYCTPGTFDVAWINIWGGIQGLIGTLPPATTLNGLRRLHQIGISGQPSLVGTLPSDWSRLTQLQDLRISNNSLSGSIPPSWGSLNKLKVLHLWGNKLGGTIPDSLQALSALEELELGKNAFVGTLPAWLGGSKFGNLKRLTLYENKLSGSISPMLGNLKQLKLLWLSYNQLNGTLPGALQALASLEDLSVHSNKLSGSIPPWLGRMTNLKVLKLYENQLNGTLPDALQALTSLEDLSVYANKLSGSIPPGLGRLTQLRVLWIGQNQLNGTLPDALKGLTSLRSLGFERTPLIGSVPRSWSAMKRLQQLWLHDSPRLTGCLPASWKQQLAGWDVGTNVYFNSGISGFC